jgi:flagellar protein FliO/FliZ
MRVLPALKRGRTASALSALLAAGPAGAQGAAAGPSIMPMVLALLLVVALVPLTAWLLKRLGAGMPVSQGSLRVVSQLALGTRERLIVVEAGDRWLLLGVSSAGINRLGTLPKGETPPASKHAPAFARLLQAARGQNDEK